MTGILWEVTATFASGQKTKSIVRASDVGEALVEFWPPCDFEQLRDVTLHWLGPLSEVRGIEED